MIIRMCSRSCGSIQEITLKPVAISHTEVKAVANAILRHSKLVFVLFFSNILISFFPAIQAGYYYKLHQVHVLSHYYDYEC